MIRWISIALLTLLPVTLWGQGMPFIHHYDAETIDSHPQNWSISQDSSGYVYFGSQAEGILRFDGINWDWNRDPGTGAIRSLQEFNSKIHWGGVGNLGYVDQDSLWMESFRLYPLKSKIDTSHRVFDDVWQMVELENKLYHRTSNSLIILEADSIKVIESEERLRGIFKVDNELWAQRENIGLNRLVNDQWEDIPGSEPFADDRLVAILPYSDYHLLIFRNSGFVKYDESAFTDVFTEADDYFQDHSLYRAITINESEIALAFLNGGIVLMKNDGSVQHILTEENGLPTDVIYEIFTDREGTLWATSLDGVIKVLPNNPLTVIQEKNGLTGSVKFIEPIDDKVYIGSTDGLYILERGNEVREFPGIDELVYDGIQLNGVLYASFPSGLFRISENESEKILQEAGYRRLEISGNHEDAFFGAYRNSVDQITIHGESLERSEVLRSESEIRQFHVADDGVWALNYNNEVLFSGWEETNVNSYMPDIQNENSVIRNISFINGKISLATDAGLYVYDITSDSFLPDSSFNLLAATSFDTNTLDTQVFQFEQCSENEVWFVSAGILKRAIRKNDGWEVTDKPSRMIGEDADIQEIRCNPDGSMWFGGTQGVFYLSDPDWQYEHEFNTNITNVSMPNDSLIYGGYGELPEQPVFTFENNELRFNYSAASYIDPEANTYRVRLEGYEDEWGDWTEETQKDYTFIPEGSYTFQVQGRNVYGKAGSIDSFSFTILPPWYRTIWAYLGYLLIAGGIIYGIYRIRINTILREQRIRDGIARDLHDELSSTLSSINFFADAINSRKLGEKENNRFLSLITKSSREAKEKVSDIVWVIHSENDDWENLFLRCKRFAADMLDSKDIEHNFSVENQRSGGPTITERKNIWLIFREIITNIARHSGAGQVDIQFIFKPGKLYINIEDDGDGFDSEEIKSIGYGVQNIKERTEQLKGKYTLQSQPGDGTHWIIELPID